MSNWLRTWAKNKGKTDKGINMDVDSDSINADIFAQLLAIFGAVNDSATDVGLMRATLVEVQKELSALRKEVAELRKDRKDPSGNPVQKREIRAVGAFGIAPHTGAG